MLLPTDNHQGAVSSPVTPRPLATPPSDVIVRLKGRAFVNVSVSVINRNWFQSSSAMTTRMEG